MNAAVAAAAAGAPPQLSRTVAPGSCSRLCDPSFVTLKASLASNPHGHQAQRGPPAPGVAPLQPWPSSTAVERTSGR